MIKKYKVISITNNTLIAHSVSNDSSPIGLSVDDLFYIERPLGETMPDHVFFDLLKNTPRNKKGFLALFESIKKYHGIENE